MIPKSGNRFSEKIMRRQKSMIPKKPAPNLIRGGDRFSKKIMLKQESQAPAGPAVASTGASLRAGRAGIGRQTCFVASTM
jgi:hypothetical protein